MGAQTRTDVLPYISLIPVFGYLWPGTSTLQILMKSVHKITSSADPSKKKPACPAECDSRNMMIIIIIIIIFGISIAIFSTTTSANFLHRLRTVKLESARTKSVTHYMLHTVLHIGYPTWHSK